MSKPRQLLLIPNLLSLFRMASVPILVMLLVLELRWVFLGLYIFAGLTDFLDGLAARVLKQKSELGKDLDAWADLIFLLSTALYMYLLFPDYLEPNIPFLGILLVFLVLSVLVGLVRFKRPVLMHTYLLKMNCWAVIIFFAASFFFNTKFLVTLVIVSYYVAFAEQTLIYLIVDVDKIDPDTPSIVSVWKDIGVEEKENGKKKG